MRMVSTCPFAPLFPPVKALPVVLPPGLTTDVGPLAPFGTGKAVPFGETTKSGALLECLLFAATFFALAAFRASYTLFPILPTLTVPLMPAFTARLVPNVPIVVPISATPKIVYPAVVQ